jgi:CheY-like chemotaxis protein
VVHVSDGVSAIEAFYEIADFDLVLCDLRLPDISGFEVLSAIRRINHSIPVIANTAYVMNEDRRKCLKAGFNDYLSKPISREDLLKVLSNP